jgi:GntR family transcriptional regulator, gluconate operon transcriptional repressor
LHVGMVMALDLDGQRGALRYRVEQAPLWQGVATRLRLLILSGEIRAGTHLVENDLAEMLGVSRGPVRQALAQLEQEGFIEIIPRQGAYVLEITAETVREKYELRRLLEEYAVSRAVDRLSAVDIAKLAMHCEEIERALSTQDLELFYGAQYRFHRGIVAAARMPSLLRLWELVGMSVGSLMVLNLYYANGEPYGDHVWQSQTATGSLSGHRDLLNVLVEGDAELAVCAVHQHLQAGESAVLVALTGARRYWDAKTV